ncbi:MAG: YggS family pyridoxal phosphate-dependent enzyme [Pyrinomonadaceae bacterium]
MTRVTAVPETIRERFEQVHARIRAAAERARRSADEITLVAISKTHPAATLQIAVSLGVTDLGENRVQEAEPKIVEVGRTAARWHLVGHLQSNKARRAVHLFDVIHSLDSVTLAQRLNRLCEEEQRNELPVLIQVDLAGEETKSGITEPEAEELARVVQGCRRLKLAGLMILPPYFEIAEQARPFFRRLRELRGELKQKGYFGDESGELSMGMSHDFEVAIEEGATMLRIGTAIFGERK